MGQPAARLTDPHVCPMVTGLVPHVGGPILPPCASTVLTGKLPQARIGDPALCVGPTDVIVKGAFTVLVQGSPAARMGDNTAHGGVIVMGLPTVLIGDAGSASVGTTGMGKVATILAVEGAGVAPAEMMAVKIAAAKQHLPFCEVCAKAAAAGK